MNFDKLVSDFLIYSYAYYIEGVSLISDADFDTICIDLVANYDNITHPHKHLIDSDMLSATTAFNLKKEDYPSVCVYTAMELIKDKIKDNSDGEPWWRCRTGYCKKHNQSFCKWVPECPICVGERIKAERDKKRGVANMKKTVIIIDANNLAFASNHTRELKTSKGEPTQALYGFIRAVGTYKKMFPLNEMIAVFDGKRSEQRIALMPNYKGNRERNTDAQSKYDDLYKQIPYIEELLLNMGCTVIKGKIEADDVIAKLAQEIAKNNVNVVIASNDKDFYQLIGKNISVYSTVKTAKVRHLTIDNFEKEKGVKPEQWLEYLALIGDSADNIPGVKGVGEKTAIKLLQEFYDVGSFIDYVNSSDYWVNKTEQKIIDNIKDFENSKAMINLQDGYIMGDVTKAEPVKGKPDKESFLKILEHFELKSIIKDIDLYF